MPRLTHRNLIIRTTALFAMIAMTGCLPQRPTANKKAEPKAVAVQAVSSVLTDVQRSTTQPATVHPMYRAEVRAKVSGYISDVQSDIGDVVAVGDSLATIDIPEIRIQREIIEARISRYQSEEARAVAGVKLAEANVRSAEAHVAQAKSAMGGSEAALAAMEAEYNRTQDLVQRQSLQSRMLDEARKKRDSERANKDSTASAIESAEANVAVAEAQQVAAEADWNAAQADTLIARRQLEELDVMIDYATLKAPFAGIVTQRFVNPGDLVRADSEVGSGQPLFAISQLESVRVHVHVPEAEAALVSRGDQVTLRFPSFPAEQPLVADVTRLSGELDPSTRTMLVEIQIENAERKLIPGMFGEATILLSTQVSATMLPARAIRYSESGEAYVYIVDDDSKVSIASITTGLDDGHSIQILAGLEPGQRVVDAHLKRFTDGQSVTVIYGEIPR